MIDLILFFIGAIVAFYVAMLIVWAAVSLLLVLISMLFD